MHLVLKRGQRHHCTA